MYVVTQHAVGFGVAEAEPASSQAAPMPPVDELLAMSLEELAGIAPRSTQSLSGEDVLRLVLTPASTFVDLISHEPALLATDVLTQLVVQLLEVNKVWVWQSMSDSVRAKFTRIVAKHKAPGVSGAQPVGMDMFVSCGCE